MKYDIVLFGYGEITAQLLKFLESKSLRLACVSRRDFNQQNFHDKVDLIKNSDLISMKIECDIAIFSWKNASPLLETKINDWFMSNQFSCDRSFLLSSASVYKDSVKAVNEAESNLRNRVDKNPKYILENYLLKLMKFKSKQHMSLRISNVYGEFLNYGLIASIINAHAKNSDLHIFNNFELTRDYLLLDDLIFAIDNLMQVSNLPNVINISTNIGTSTTQLLQIFKNKNILVNCKISNSQPVSLHFTSILDCTLLESFIPWKPTKLEDGLSKILHGHHF